MTLAGLLVPWVLARSDGGGSTGWQLGWVALAVLGAVATVVAGLALRQPSTHVQRELSYVATAGAVGAVRHELHGAHLLGARGELGAGAEQRGHPELLQLLLGGPGTLDEVVHRDNLIVLDAGEA